jgi:hypothetical protein
MLPAPNGSVKRARVVYRPSEESPSVERRDMVHFVGRPERVTPREAEGWRASVVLFGLVMAGQAAALSLIDAPHYAVYQHYRAWADLSVPSRLPAVATLAVQATVCLLLGYRARADLTRAAKAIAPRWYLILAVAIMGFATAVPTESIRRFAGEVVLSSLVTGVSALNLVFAVRALPTAALHTIAEYWTSLSPEGDATPPQRRWESLLPRLAALWVVVVSSLLAYFVWERVPHIDDSITYLFQAKYLSLGRLWLPRPVDPESFGVAHLLVDGDRWYGKFFPGWPAVLALGVVLGAPWLVNPVLGALTILLTHRLVKSHYDIRTAHAAVLLLAVSPWFLFMSASFMAHTVSLCLLLLALVAIDVARQRGSHSAAMGAGASLGLLFLTRPFDAALVGPVVGLWTLGMGARRLRVANILTVGVAAALVAGTYFVYNKILTGDARIAPHRLWADHVFGVGADRFGFGPDRGVSLWTNMDPLPGHGLADVILNANKNLATMNFELFGWVSGSLALALLALQPSALQRRDALLLGIVLSVVVGHAFYWAPGGPDLGARYWYLLILPGVVLTARGADLISRRLDLHAARVGAFVVLASISAMMTVLPWRIATKHFRYRDIGGEIRTLASQHGIRDGLVFVRSSRRSDYQQAFNLNPASLDQPGTIYVWDQGPEHRARVLRQFSRRSVWVIERTSEADPTLKLSAGPLAPGTDPPGTAPVTAQSLQAVLR